MKKIHIFTHNDLDGMGVQIIGRLYAQSVGMPCEVHKCNYQTINQEVMKCLSGYRDGEIEEIIIGDISVLEDTAKMLDLVSKLGIPVSLRDHHATAEWLNKYDWAYVAEKEMGIPYCGTWLLAMDYSEIYQKMAVFVNTVDDWDTWKWKTNGNVHARRLATLYKTMSDEEFIEYIMNLDMDNVKNPEDLFTVYANKIVDATEKTINSAAKGCEENMWVSTMKFKTHNKKKVALKVGIVFAYNNVSEIADYIIDRHPELDLVMIGALPRAFSFRTQKDLPIPLGEIAKQVTGSGGGHPHSAGAAISTEKFQDGFFNFFCAISGGARMESLKPLKEKKNRK